MGIEKASNLENSQVMFAFLQSQCLAHFKDKIPYRIGSNTSQVRQYLLWNRSAVLKEARPPTTAGRFVPE